MLKTTRFIILRNVEANGRQLVDLPEKPKRVATLLNEEAFNDGNFLIHSKTVFFEDQIHDWNWKCGKFRYYTRVADRADVVIVYEEQDVSMPPKFDPMTGEAL